MFFRELSKKAQKANNVWWRLSGLLGDQNRMLMYIFLQAIFTVATMALTVPIFLSYELHVVFQILKVSASIWNGGSFLLEVMPKQAILKEKKKSETQPAQGQMDQSSIVMENGSEFNNTVGTSETWLTQLNIHVFCSTCGCVCFTDPWFWKYEFGLVGHDKCIFLFLFSFNVHSFKMDSCTTKFWNCWYVSAVVFFCSPISFSCWSLFTPALAKWNVILERLK